MKRFERQRARPVERHCSTRRDGRYGIGEVGEAKETGSVREGASANEPVFSTDAGPSLRWRAGPLSLKSRAPGVRDFNGAGGRNRTDTPCGTRF